MPIEMLGTDTVREDFLEQVAALVLRQTDDAGGEMLADEKRLATRFRMRAHDRVHDRLHLRDLPGRQIWPPWAALLQFRVSGEVGVLGHAPFHCAAQMRRQCVPRE